MDGVKKLADFQDAFFNLVKESSTKLLSGNVQEDLDSGNDFPVSLKADFSLLIGEIGALKETKNLFEGIVAELRTDITRLLQSKNFEDFADNFRDLVQIDQLKRLPDVLRGIVYMEVGLMLSFVATTKNLEDLKIEDYEDSFNQYFFSKDGYKTVSGNLITRPRLPKISSLSEIKEIGNRIDAERYVRDMARIIVETGGDRLYDLRTRYPNFIKKYQKKRERKLVDWFDSFGDLAEASLLPVIEGIVNGAFNIQLNPLVAAALGTFCSVTVRKGTEHSYLALLGITN
jgi:hypothetical protein